MSKNSKNFVPTVHQKAGEINRTNPDWRLDLIRNGGYNRWPEDPACDPKYQLQRLPLVQLRNPRYLAY